MEHIVGATINELREEFKTIDTVNTVKEPSWIVRCVQLKLKCFIIMVIGGLLSMLIIGSTITEILRDDEAGEMMTQAVSLIKHVYFPNSTLDVSDIMNAAVDAVQKE